MGGMGGGAKGQSQTGTQNLSMGGGPTEMRTGGPGAFLGQQWDPSQWNTDLGLGYYGVPAGQQQGFAQGASVGNGAKGNASWPAWSGSEPHPLVQIANHFAGIMGAAGSESDSGEGASGGEATGPSGGDNMGDTGSMSGAALGGDGSPGSGGADVGGSSDTSEGDSGASDSGFE